MVENDCSTDLSSTKSSMRCCKSVVCSSGSTRRWTLPPPVGNAFDRHTSTSEQPELSEHGREAPVIDIAREMRLVSAARSLRQPLAPRRIGHKRKDG